MSNTFTVNGLLQGVNEPPASQSRGRTVRSASLVPYRLHDRYHWRERPAVGSRRGLSVDCDSKHARVAPTTSQQRMATQPNRNSPSFESLATSKDAQIIANSAIQHSLRSPRPVRRTCPVAVHRLTLQHVRGGKFRGTSFPAKHDCRSDSGRFRLWKPLFSLTAMCELSASVRRTPLSSGAPFASLAGVLPRPDCGSVPAVVSASDTPPGGCKSRGNFACCR